MAINGNAVLLYGGSGASSFDTTTPRGTATERVLPAQIKQLVWDPASALLYASVGSDAVQYANSVVAIDPFSGTVTQSRVLGPAPNALAVSADGRFLYVGIDGEGTVQRLRLPSLDLDLTLSLGQRPSYQTPYTAGVIRVSPTQPDTVAVTRVVLNISPSQLGGVVLFDNAVQRPVIAGGETYSGGFLFPADIAWNTDGSGLYALEIISNALLSLEVAADGVSVGARLGAVANLGGALRLDRVNRLLSTDGGGVLDVTSVQPVGTYRPAYYVGPHNVAPGSTGAEVFTLYLNQPTNFAPVSEIAIYDATRFVPKKIYTITGSNEMFTYDFVQLRTGWFAFRSSRGVHIIQLAP
jgi:DNA-binding beta-propeller fold protein YncE